jgi:hypothetical protein
VWQCYWNGARRRSCSAQHRDSLCLRGGRVLLGPRTDQQIFLPAQRAAAEAPTLAAPITLQGAAWSNQSRTSGGGTWVRCVPMHPKLHVSSSLHLSSQPPCPRLLTRTWLAQIRLRLPSFALLPKIFSVCTIDLFHNLRYMYKKNSYSFGRSWNQTLFLSFF